MNVSPEVKSQILKEQAQLNDNMKNLAYMELLTSAKRKNESDNNQQSQFEQQVSPNTYYNQRIKETQPTEKQVKSKKGANDGKNLRDLREENAPNAEKMTLREL